jgi:hypothetical protein
MANLTEFLQENKIKIKYEVNPEYYWEQLTMKIKMKIFTFTYLVDT